MTYLYFILFIIIITWQPVAAVNNLQTGEAVTDTAEVMRLIRQSDKFIYNNPDKALELAYQAKLLSEKIDFNKGNAKSYERIGNVYFHLGKKAEAQSNYCKALEVLNNYPEDDIAGSVYYNLSNLQYELGNYDSTLFYTEKAKQHYIAANDSGGYAICLFMDAEIYDQQGNYYKSLKNKLAALEVFKQQDMKLWETDCLMSIAGIYAMRGEYEKSLDIYQQCLQQYRELNDKKFECVALRCIGFQYSNLKDYRQSISYLDQSIALSREKGFTPEETKSTSRKADVLMNAGNHAEAEKWYTYSLKLSNQITDNYYNARNLAGIGHALIYQGKPREAINKLNKSLSISQDIDNATLKKDIFKFLAMANDSIGNIDEAYTAYKKYRAYNDSIIKEETSRQLSETKAEYDIEKAENEIALLEKEKATSENIRKLTVTGWALTALSALLLIFFLVYKYRKNRQLLAKEKEIDKMKSRFFADISHEFRTPLTLILGPLGKLKNENRLLPFKQDLGLIEKNAKRLLHLINQILDLSKIESGKYELHIQRNEFITFLKRIFYTYESYAEIKNISYNLLLPEGTVVADFDDVNLETVFNNLLSNALKFEPKEGYVEVNVGATDQKIQVTILNRGAFINSEIQDKIFTRYFSSPNDMAGSGTGIGLALVKELIEMHQGTIQMESSVERGTAFHISFPRYSFPVSTVPFYKKNNRSLFPKKQTRSHSWPEQIWKVTKEKSNFANNTKEVPVALVIEDNREVNNFIQECLKSEFRVVSSEDGNSGVKVAIEQIPDIIISDVMMPGISGIEVCNELKKNEITSHIPIILLTAKASPESKIEGLKSKADDYLSKPFIPEELLTRMHNLLDNRKLMQKKYSGVHTSTISITTEKSMDQVFLEKINELIANNMANENFNVEECCKRAGISRSQLHRKLIALTGISASEYIRNYRLEKAMDMLKNNIGTASEVAYMVGFQSPIYFTKCFRDYYNVTPGSVRKSTMETKTDSE